jgi:hypothetical protein
MVAVEMKMTFGTGWILRPILAATVAVSLPAAATVHVYDNHPTVRADGCANGVTPWNPYVGNCALGPRPPKIRGSAPDASAIIACRHKPGCLATFINNP